MFCSSVPTTRLSPTAIATPQFPQSAVGSHCTVELPIAIESSWQAVVMTQLIAEGLFTSEGAFCCPEWLQGASFPLLGFTQLERLYALFTTPIEIKAEAHTSTTVLAELFLGLMDRFGIEFFEYTGSDLYHCLHYEWFESYFSLLRCQKIYKALPLELVGSAFPGTLDSDLRFYFPGATNSDLFAMAQYVHSHCNPEGGELPTRANSDQSIFSKCALIDRGFNHGFNLAFGGESRGQIDLTIIERFSYTSIHEHDSLVLHIDKSSLKHLINKDWDSLQLRPEGLHLGVAALYITRLLYTPNPKIMDLTALLAKDSHYPRGAVYFSNVLEKAVMDRLSPQLIDCRSRRTVNEKLALIASRHLASTAAAHAAVCYTDLTQLLLNGGKELISSIDVESVLGKSPNIPHGILETLFLLMRRQQQPFEILFNYTSIQALLYYFRSSIGLSTASIAVKSHFENGSSTAQLFIKQDGLQPLCIHISKQLLSALREVDSYRLSSLGKEWPGYPLVKSLERAFFADPDIAPEKQFPFSPLPSLAKNFLEPTSDTYREIIDLALQWIDLPFLKLIGGGVLCHLGAAEHSRKFLPTLTRWALTLFDHADHSQMRQLLQGYLYHVEQCTAAISLQPAQWLEDLALFIESHWSSRWNANRMLILLLAPLAIDEILQPLCEEWLAHAQQPIESPEAHSHFLESGKILISQTLHDHPHRALKIAEALAKHPATMAKPLIDVMNKLINRYRYSPMERQAPSDNSELTTAVHLLTHKLALQHEYSSAELNEGLFWLLEQWLDHSPNDVHRLLSNASSGCYLHNNPERKVALQQKLLSSSLRLEANVFSWSNHSNIVDMLIGGHLSPEQKASCRQLIARQISDMAQQSSPLAAAYWLKSIKKMTDSGAWSLLCEEREQWLELLLHLLGEQFLKTSQSDNNLVLETAHLLLDSCRNPITARNGALLLETLCQFFHRYYPKGMPMRLAQQFTDRRLWISQQLHSWCSIQEGSPLLAICRLLQTFDFFAPPYCAPAVTAIWQELLACRAGGKCLSAEEITALSHLLCSNRHHVRAASDIVALEHALAEDGLTLKMYEIAANSIAYCLQRCNHPSSTLLNLLFDCCEGYVAIQQPKAAQDLMLQLQQLPIDQTARCSMCWQQIALSQALPIAASAALLIDKATIIKQAELTSAFTTGIDRQRQHLAQSKLPAEIKMALQLAEIYGNTPCDFWKMILPRLSPSHFEIAIRTLLNCTELPVKTLHSCWLTLLEKMVAQKSCMFVDLLDKVEMLHKLLHLAPGHAETFLLLTKGFLYLLHSPQHRQQHFYPVIAAVERAENLMEELWNGENAATVDLLLIESCLNTSNPSLFASLLQRLQRQTPKGSLPPQILTLYERFLEQYSRLKGDPEETIMAQFWQQAKSFTSPATSALVAFVQFFAAQPEQLMRSYQLLIALLRAIPNQLTLSENLLKRLKKPIQAIIPALVSSPTDTARPLEILYHPFCQKLFTPRELAELWEFVILHHFTCAGREAPCLTIDDALKFYRSNHSHLKGNPGSLQACASAYGQALIGPPHQSIAIAQLDLAINAAFEDFMPNSLRSTFLKQRQQSRELYLRHKSLWQSNAEPSPKYLMDVLLINRLKGGQMTRSSCTKEPLVPNASALFAFLGGLMKGLALLRTEELSIHQQIAERFFTYVATAAEMWPERMAEIHGWIYEYAFCSLPQPIDSYLEHAKLLITLFKHLFTLSPIPLDDVKTSDLVLLIDVNLYIENKVSPAEQRARVISLLRRMTALSNPIWTTRAIIIMSNVQQLLFTDHLSGLKQCYAILLKAIMPIPFYQPDQATLLELAFDSLVNIEASRKEELPPALTIAIAEIYIEYFAFMAEAVERFPLPSHRSCPCKFLVGQLAVFEVMPSMFQHVNVLFTLIDKLMPVAARALIAEKKNFMTAYFAELHGRYGHNRHSHRLLLHAMGKWMEYLQQLPDQIGQSAFEALYHAEFFRQMSTEFEEEPDGEQQ